MKVLVPGSTGQIGWELMSALQPLGCVYGTTRKELDLRHQHEIVRCMRDTRPDVVVNAAAFTAVDRAEIEPDVANAVNATAVGVMAEECRRAGALLVHYSSDYVFDGESHRLYEETSVPRPLNVYGASKLLGDQLIERSGCRHLILRVSGVYSLRRNNFMLSIIQKARAGRELRVVADQFCAPTPAWLIAELTAHLLHLRRRDERLEQFDGIVNVACAGSTSWHDFAVAIVDSLTTRPPSQEIYSIARCPPIVAITSREFPSAVCRPKRAELDLGRLRNEWGLVPTPWEVALALTLRHA